MVIVIAPSIRGPGAVASPVPPPTADDDDSAALSLPSASTATPGTLSPLSLATEAAATAAAQRGDGTASEERLSFDLRDDTALTPGWRAVVADRLDLDWSNEPQQTGQINTLKEAYLSWQPQTDLLFDAGRINVREGVALGYNPTDFFRAGALRAVDSLDPGSLRDNRQGSVMLRSETLWDSGALTALYSPRLAEGSSSAPFNPDWGATNAAGRWLVSVSQKLRTDWTPQWLLFGTQGSSPQFGMNLTTVLGTSTVLYLETSEGHGASLWTQALGMPLDAATLAAGVAALSGVSPQPAMPPAEFSSVSPRVHASFEGRAATGITYTATNKLSLSLEYEYDGAALNRANWSLARRGNPLDYALYRDFVSTNQEPATQQNLFVYASWQDLIVQHLDLAAFIRLDLIDHSSLPWSELRYHWPRVDAALRWQNYAGGVTSDYGAAASRQTWQLLVDYYL